MLRRLNIAAPGMARAPSSRSLNDQFALASDGVSLALSVARFYSYALPPSEFQAVYCAPWLRLLRRSLWRSRFLPASASAESRKASFDNCAICNSLAQSTVSRQGSEIQPSRNSAATPMTTNAAAMFRTRGIRLSQYKALVTAGSFTDPSYRIGMGAFAILWILLRRGKRTAPSTPS